MSDTLRPTEICKECHPQWNNAFHGMVIDGVELCPKHAHLEAENARLSSVTRCHHAKFGDKHNHLCALNWNHADEQQYEHCCQCGETWK